MPAALDKMSIAERERYVRWWLEESGLTRVQLRAVAGVTWAGRNELGDASAIGRLRPVARRER